MQPSKVIIHELDFNPVKTLRKILLLSLFFMLSGSRIADAQSDPFINYFSAFKSGSHIQLNWQIALGNTCNGIAIHRGSDSTSLVRIGLIPGICGSESEALRYQFTDEMPEQNKSNYYQLEFGGAGVSPIVAVFFADTGTEGYHLQPHPVQDYARLYFRNDDGLDYELTIYTINGLRKSQISTREDFFDITVEGWNNGLYVFSIRRKENPIRIRGHFIVISH